MIDACISKIQENQLTEELKGLKDKINYSIIDNQNKNEKILTDDEIIKKYNIFSKAIKYNQKIKIRYQNLQHGISTRTVYPLSLYLFQGEWWCSCYWEEQNDMRQFHLTRILEAEILEEYFNPNLINVKF